MRIFKIFLDIPYQWQGLFQDPATQIMESLIDFHHDLMFYILFIAGFVVTMLIQIIYTYNYKHNYIQHQIF